MNLRSDRRIFHAIALTTHHYGRKGIIGQLKSYFFASFAFFAVKPIG
jgi:hypothetical protein